MLAVENLSIEYGARCLFRDLTFTIRAKERWALAGPNGAGKTTFFNLLTYFDKPNMGSVVFDGDRSTLSAVRAAPMAASRSPRQFSGTRIRRMPIRTTSSITDTPPATWRSCGRSVPS